MDGAKTVVGEAEAPHTVTVSVDPRRGWCAKFEAGSGVVLAERAAAGKVRVE
ncbi:thioredoxin domain-containing protein [Streptomyces sp. NPDC101115]|uniref:thioredoxin domain-containing protein n=1 Tax=Streptomyces sp. NPDC101115 TaxID=3366106 RepID=UPI003812BA4E